jgi:hypothetical protein
VRIGRQEERVVLDDDEVAIAAQPGTGVDDAAIGRSQHRITRRASDRQPLGLAGLVEAGEQRAGGRPGPGHVLFGLARCRGGGRRRGGCLGPGGRCRCRPCSDRGAWRTGCTRGGRGGCAGHRCGGCGAAFERPRLDAPGGRHRPRHRCPGLRARRNDAQLLAHLDQVGVVQAVPARQVAPALPVVERDAAQRIPGPHGVETRARGGIRLLRRGRRHRRRGGCPRAGNSRGCRRCRLHRHRR